MIRKANFMHQTIDPAILYFGTPVILVSTLNEDGSANLAPLSSAWWIGHRCVIDIGKTSKTTENLLRTRQCVINLPSADQVAAVDRLALTTGTNPVPDGKSRRGYRHVKDKFKLSHLTPLQSELVSPPRIHECPIHMEAELYSHHELAENDPRWGGRAMILETKIIRIHVEDYLRLHPFSDRIDPDLWKPLIMSFQKYYGLSLGQLHSSQLASIPEEQYRP